MKSGKLVLKSIKRPIIIDKIRRITKQLKLPVLQEEKLVDEIYGLIADYELEWEQSVSKHIKSKLLPFVDGPRSKIIKYIKNIEKRLSTMDDCLNTLQYDLKTVEDEFDIESESGLFKWE